MSDKLKKKRNYFEHHRLIIIENKEIENKETTSLRGKSNKFALIGNLLIFVNLISIVKYFPFIKNNFNKIVTLFFLLLYCIDLLHSYNECIQFHQLASLNLFEYLLYFLSSSNLIIAIKKKSVSDFEKFTKMISFIIILSTIKIFVSQIFFFNYKETCFFQKIDINKIYLKYIAIIATLIFILGLSYYLRKLAEGF